MIWFRTTVHMCEYISERVLTDARCDVVSAIGMVMSLRVECRDVCRC